VPFTEGEFSACRVERALMHVEDPSTAAWCAGQQWSIGDGLAVSAVRHKDGG
jgi:hypothetical protein